MRYMYYRLPHAPGLELEGIETLGMITTEYPPPELELLMEDFVLWTGVWRQPLYPPRTVQANVMTVLKRSFDRLTN